MLLKRIVIGRIILRHVGWHVRELNTSAISALQIIELVAQAEHHLSSRVRFVSRSVPANLASVHEGGYVETRLSDGHIILRPSLSNEWLVSPAANFRLKIAISIVHLF